MLTEDFPKFPHVKTEECRTPAEIVENKCEDCNLKCEDPKTNSGWLDPNNNSGIYHHKCIRA